MSALENLLDEVRLEAEQAVRTEYENTVVEQRARITELENELATITKDRDLWRNSEKNTSALYDELLDAVDGVVKAFR